MDGYIELGDYGHCYPGPSFAKLETAIHIAEEVTPEEAPDLEMPVYDERGMESVRRVGLGMYMEDSLTTANFGKIFVD